MILNEATVLSQVRDVEGCFWDVLEMRDTKHGFDLLFGAPAPQTGTDSCGLPRLIVTQPLFDFWDAHRTSHNGVLFDLPAGRTTLKRARRRLGFSYLTDLSYFWKERMDDLAALSGSEFAVRHNVDIRVVFETRLKLLGRTARELDWWRKARPLKILRSNITLREMGERLSISITHAKRLSDRARAEV
jgi:hypothetical protein